MPQPSSPLAVNKTQASLVSIIGKKNFQHQLSIKVCADLY